MDSMSTPTDNPPRNKYEWLDPWVEEFVQGAIAFTVARSDSPEKFLAGSVGARLLSLKLRGVPALAAERPPDRVLVGVMPAPGKPGWILAAESPGVIYEKASQLSAGGVAVAVHSTQDSGVWLKWAERGADVAELSLTDDDVDDVIVSNDPPGLAQQMRAAGLNTDYTANHPCAAAAILIEMITRDGDIPGVVITRHDLETAEFTTGSLPFP
jgi:hypothetical protein